MGLSDTRAFVLCVAAYYKMDLADMVVKMYADDLKNYPIEILMDAFKRMRLASYRLKMPLPWEFIKFIDPERANANDAIACFGNNFGRLYGNFNEGTHGSMEQNENTTRSLSDDEFSKRESDEKSGE